MVAAVRTAVTALSLLLAASGASATTIYRERFDAGLGSASTSDACGSGSTWEWTDACVASPDAPSAGHARWGVPGNCSRYSDNNGTTVLETPAIDVSECVLDLWYGFWYLLDLEEGPRFDRVRVDRAYDADWSQRWDNGDNGGDQELNCSGVANAAPFDLVSDATWRQTGLWIRGAAPEQIKLRFVGETFDDFDNDGQGFLVDDIEVSCRLRGSGTTFVLDTFDDDIAGEPPGGAEVGVADYARGDHVVVDQGGGDLALQSTDDDIADSLLVTYHPEGFLTLPRSLTEYVVRIGGGASLVGDSAFYQQPVLGGGNNVSLWWGDDHRLRLRITGYDPDVTLDTGVDWVADRDHYIVWIVDTVRDTFSVWVDSQPLAVDESLGGDATGLGQLYFGTNVPTLGTQIIDEVRITEHTWIFEDGFESGNTWAWSSP